MSASTLYAYDGFEKYASPTVDMLDRISGSRLVWTQCTAGSFVAGRYSEGKALSLIDNLQGGFGMAFTSGTIGFDVSLEAGTTLGVAFVDTTSVYGDKTQFTLVLEQASGTAYIARGGTNYAAEGTALSGGAGFMVFNGNGPSPPVVRGMSVTGGIFTPNTTTVENIVTVGTSVSPGVTDYYTTVTCNGGTFAGSDLVSFGETLGVAAGVVVPSGWFKLEIGAIISSSSGEITTNINGVTVADLSTCWGGNNNASSNGNFNSVLLITNGATILVDNFYMDTAVFRGPNSQIITSFPTANGSIVTWTPLTSTNWVEVSETAFDGDTSYNYTTTVGAIDEFHVQPLPDPTVDVLAVQVTGAYDSTGIVNELVSSGTVGTGGTVSPGGGSSEYQFVSDMFTLDPATGAAWTTLAAEAAQPRYRQTS